MDAARAREVHDDLLAARPEGARHDSDICPFCTDKAQATTFGTPPGTAGPDATEKSDQNTKGGDTPTMTDISQETHTALLNQAVTDAVKTTDAALAAKTAEADQAQAKVTELESTNTTLAADVARLNKELDEAQVKLSAATEEVANLKKEAADKEEAASRAEMASKRTDQVRNLKLFPDEYVAERAERWATLTDEAWAEQIDEWSKLKPATPEDGQEGDTASAMSGTSDPTKETKQDTAGAAGGDKPNPRRLALGLS